MSETTVVKGQFGLVQSGGTGKKLKIFILQMFKPPTPNQRRDELKFINIICGVHDTLCDCYSPVQHASKILQKHLEQQQCHTDTTTAAVEDDHGLDFGEDLEKLFAQDTDVTEEDPITG